MMITISLIIKLGVHVFVLKQKENDLLKSFVVNTSKILITIYHPNKLLKFIPYLILSVNITSKYPLLPNHDSEHKRPNHTFA